MKFYTSAIQIKNNIYVRGWENGKRFNHRVAYKPYMFISSSAASSKYRTLENKIVERIDFDSIYDAKDFIRRYEGVGNFPLYGMDRFLYPYLNDEYSGHIEHDFSLIQIGIIDIEVESKDGFPDIDRANNEITAISCMVGDTVYAFGCKPCSTKFPNVEHIQCVDEKDLLLKFLAAWRKWDLDIVTGWNIEFFDIPYLINRIRVVCGEEAAKSLSPMGLLWKNTIKIYGEDKETYNPVGVAVLDYLSLYKKFTYSQQESYSLDNIAFVELEERKLNYSEYEDLNDLYDKNYDKFIEYNARDCILVKRINDKNGFLEQVVQMAYDAHVNYNDALTTVLMWDCIIHSFLMQKNIVIPRMVHKPPTHKIAGGYVKEPIPGKYKWVLSFDLDSLYPHLIMQYNISPETLAGTTLPITIPQVLEKNVDVQIREQLLARNQTVSALGIVFDKSRHGFLPELMLQIYNDRKIYKKRMIDAKKELHGVEEEMKSNPSPMLKAKAEQLVKDVSRNNNMQMAAKIKLNSAYGACANEYFRYFDERLAESITLSGQLSIQWIALAINNYFNKLLKTDADYIVASDTDSIYVTFDEIVNRFCAGKSTSQIVDYLDNLANTSMADFIEKSFGELSTYMNAYEQKMHMKRESIVEVGIWTGKKRYVLSVRDQEGVRFDNDPYIKITGLEAVRSSVPRVAREIIKKAYKIILTQDEDTLISFVAEQREKFMAMPFEDIAFPRGVNGMKEYYDPFTLYAKATPIHVRASLLYNKMIRDKKLDKQYRQIGDGDKIKFSYLKMPNPINENVIATLDTLPRKLGLDQYVDYDMQFSKTVLEPLKTVLAPINWHYEKRSSLQGFFT